MTIRREERDDSASWSPVIGDNTEQLGDTLKSSGALDLAEFKRVRTESLQILQYCLRPSAESGRRTGLIIGYVQSGKTLSMTTVAALARDNRFRLFIVLAGTKKNLVEQSKSRFARELRGGGTHLRWEMWNNPTDGESRQDLEVLVDEWKDARIPEEDQRALFITVMKQHTHLQNLTELLEGVRLEGITALVFDDEADQAGLNTQPDEDLPSTTYRRILRLRELLPRHTYLQYTATPQAPLLINLLDILSPDFSEVIEPGKSYTGGRTFFIDRTNLVRPIPPHDAPDAREDALDPPPSLLSALRVYFLGVAAAHLENRAGFRSMLIHPSIRRASHSQFTTWVHAIKQRWRTELAPPDGKSDAARDAEIAEFKKAYEDLKSTAPDIPAFRDLLRPLWTIIGRTVVTEVNSQTGREVDWSRGAWHILVGGAKLERGFTVEGLTVTYMPRGAGAGNADVIQQRARFYGYKLGYLGYCRVYLPSDMAQAYASYVAHEEDVREQLRGHRGRPLREWRRAFYLDRKYRPTRSMVVKDPYYFMSGASSRWFKQSSPHFAPEVAKRNAQAVDALLRSLKLTDWAKHANVLVASGVSLRSVMEQLLADYGFLGPRDRVQGFGTMVRLMEHLARTPDALASVFLMSRGQDRKRTTRDSKDDAVELHQGRGSSGAEKGYPGDEAAHDPTVVTVQVHWVTVETASKESLKHLPALAIRLPDSIRGNDLLVQDQALSAGS